MPIMAAHGQSDARGAARLLARTAVECLDNPKIARRQEVALNNVYRLLESFRTNRFFGNEAPAHQAVKDAVDSLVLMPPAERYVKDVKRALEDATYATFRDRDRDSAIQSVVEVLRAISAPASKDELAVSEADRARAVQFFRELSQRLQSN